MNREQFAEWQTRLLEDTFSLTSGESEARGRFEQLSLDTYDFMSSNGLVWSPVNPLPKHAGNFLTGYVEHDLGRRWPNVTVPSRLVGRWEAWNREACELLTRNPRLELREMLQDVSESNDASSWPCGYEHRIQDWIDKGNPLAPPPFSDRHGMATPAFFDRLCKLRTLCGGWLYWDDHLRRVVFLPEPEWKQVRATREAEEAKRKSEWEESRAKSERRERRLQDIVAIARRDVAFWKALKAWEAKRPGESPGRGMTFISIKRSVSTDLHADGNGPGDMIFVDFIARLHQPDDDLVTVPDIIVALSTEARGELGMDKT